MPRVLCLPEAVIEASACAPRESCHALLCTLIVFSTFARLEGGEVVILNEHNEISLGLDLGPSWRRRTVSIRRPERYPRVGTRLTPPSSTPSRSSLSR